MRSHGILRRAALLAVATAFVSGCSDSTGVNLDSNSALASLAIGLNAFAAEPGAPSGAEAAGVFNAIAPLLDRVSVTIDGGPQTMYALGIRQSFPAGTCEETLYEDPQFPPPTGVCTPPPFGMVVVLWQTHSAMQPPDKLLLLTTEIGTSTFDFSSATFPAVAFYVEGQDKIFISESGTVTTQMVSSGATCSIPLPPYAKTGTCKIATFSQQGSIVLSPVSEGTAVISSNAPSAPTVTLGIPSITLDGLWVDITEVQPVTFGPFDYSRGSLIGVFPSRARPGVPHGKVELPAGR
jgi:hypothetical protein